MLYQKTENGYLVRLVRGEKLLDVLTSFCVQHSIHSGFFSGIGAVTEAEIGFYHLDKKEYEFKVFTKDYELVSLTGNISLLDNKPFLHAHAVFAGDDFSCIGGHVKDATIGATCEIYVTPFNQAIERVYDEEIGLKLLNCTTK